MGVQISKDTGDIDRSLATTSTIFVRAFIQIIGTLVIIGMSTPYTLDGFAPVMCIFYWTYRVFQVCEQCGMCGRGCFRCVYSVVSVGVGVPGV